MNAEAETSLPAQRTSAFWTKAGHRLVSLILAVLTAGSPSVLACAACFGRTDDRLAQGMNAGILTLLAIILAVLAGVVAFFIYVAWRTHALSARPAAPAPPKT